MVITVLRALGSALGTLLAPDTCAACKAGVPARTVFCPTCARSVTEAPYRGPLRVAPYAYGGAVALAITAFKYERRPHLARPLGDLLRRGLPRLLPFSPDVVVPVPLHPSRLAERGFNHSALIARPVARSLGVALAPLALRRTRDTPRQATLDQASRAANVADAFVARYPAKIRAARVLLIDDVCTTGATLGACEDALLAAGVLEVRALVIAVAERLS